MPKPRAEYHERQDSSWGDEDDVVLSGGREWKRHEMRSIGDESVRAALRSGRAKVIREFLSKDGTLFKPTA